MYSISDLSIWKVPSNHEWDFFSFHEEIRSINVHDILLSGKIEQ